MSKNIIFMETINSNMLDKRELTEKVIGLVIPESNIIGINSIEFKNFLEDNLENGYDIDVYGDADNVSYLSLNSIIIDIGVFCATTIGFPILVNLLSDYIQSKISEHKSSNLSIRGSLIKIDKKNKTKSKIKYHISGEAEDVIKALKEIDKDE